MKLQYLYLIFIYEISCELTIKENGPESSGESTSRSSEWLSQSSTETVSSTLFFNPYTYPTWDVATEPVTPKASWDDNFASICRAIFPYIVTLGVCFIIYIVIKPYFCDAPPDAPPDESTRIHATRMVSPVPPTRVSTRGGTRGTTSMATLPTTPRP